MPYKDKDVKKAYQHNYDMNHKDVDLKKNLKKRYNITFEEKNRMYISQNGSCAICLKKLSGVTDKETHIDHDHKTGKIRELLCNNCNVGIGYLKEDIMILTNALTYLRKWKE